MFLRFGAVVLLTSVLGASIGMFVGNLSNDHKKTTQFMPIFFVPFIILAGFIASTKTLPWAFKWMGYISPFKYMMEILLRGEFSDVHWAEPLILEAFDYELGTKICYSVVIGYIVVFRVAAYWLMTKKVAKFN
jgi:ABC-type multidrug transport system permease subunit